MARSYLVLLLLLNYLLVVGAGLVERPAPKPVERAFAYVHSADCPQKNYLRAGCFDDCNGTQYEVQQHHDKMPLHQLLTTLKALDLHCLPESPALTSGRSFATLETQLAAPDAAVLIGFRGIIDSPPRRG